MTYTPYTFNDRILNIRGICSLQMKKIGKNNFKINF